LLGRGMISAEDFSLYRVTDSVEEAAAEMLDFYRVYHSMRYVHEQLVLRLMKPPSEKLVETLNTDYSDILLKGKITASQALPEEHDDPVLADLPRLIFHFNRRNFGRLRQLIDVVNKD
jgi:hypothetical protein